MTDQPTTSLNYAYPVKTAVPNQDGTVSLSIAVVNYDAEEKLKQILAEFQGIDPSSTDVSLINIEQMADHPGIAPHYQITDGNIEALVDYLTEAGIISDTEVEEIEVDEIQSRLEELDINTRNEILNKLEIQSGKIESIDWETKPDNYNEQGEIIMSVYSEHAQELIHRINNDGFSPDGLPKINTDRDQLDLF